METEDLGRYNMAVNCDKSNIISIGYEQEETEGKGVN